MPKNYRPIAILPVLCKIYSKLLLQLISGALEACRTPEEMGFRKEYACRDLVHSLRMVGEKCIEWGESVWIASLDLEKAFDKVLHSAVFSGLREAGIEESLIKSIRQLYTEQFSFIQLEPHLLSRYFSILRGVRQGDPMSPALFTNTIRTRMARRMAKLNTSWEARGLGTSIGSNHFGKHRLTYAMFADDTTLFAKSRRGMKLMLQELSKELDTIGLNLNAEKCKLQCSTWPTDRTGTLEVGTSRYPVVARSEGFKVLGTTFTLDASTDVEYQARINAAWAKFWALWPLLGKRDAPLKKRLELLQSTVAMTLLWCAETWALTVKQKRHLRAVQRSMLRKVMGIRRQPEEEYIQWIRRATKTAEQEARKAGVKCWLSMHLVSKWRWGGTLANFSQDRWAARTTFWRDSEWWSYQPRGGSSYGARPIRARPGNMLRWECDLRKFAAQVGWNFWQIAAKSSVEWQAQEDAFVSHAWR